MTRALAFLAFLLVACGGAPEGQEQPLLVVSPDAQLSNVATDWAAIWSAATGRAISIGEGGVPFRAVDSVPGGACGHSELRFSESGRFLRAIEVLIDVTPPEHCVAWGYTMGHEMAHALSGVDHTSDQESLMALSPDQGVEHTADASAVALVCSAIDCAD